MRGLLGIGVPYLNSWSMPFEKASAGGATDMRGRRARRLGPGSFNQGTDFVFDQFADLKLLLQFEYRLTLIKQIELGFFADAGNIWAPESRSATPWRQFRREALLQGNCLGSRRRRTHQPGLLHFPRGSRIPLYDPTVEPKTNGLVVKYMKRKSVVWNFAINYPF